MKIVTKFCEQSLYITRIAVDSGITGVKKIKGIVIYYKVKYLYAHFTVIIPEILTRSYEILLQT